MKKLTKYIILILIFTAMICVSSTSFAGGKTLEITCAGDGSYTFSPTQGNTKSDGTAQHPFVLSLAYDTIEIDYAPYGKTKFPFYFTIEAGDGNKIGQYIVKHDYEKKKVTFSLVAARSNVNSSSFSVATGTRKIGDSYVQAGAILNEQYDATSFIAPTYKIVSYETMKATSGAAKTVLVTTLGNAYLESSDSAAGSLAPYGSAYILAATGVPKTDLYAVNDFQDDAQLYVNTVDSNYKTTGDAEIKMSAAKTSYLSNGNAEIVYAFYGATSENLDNNEVNGVEKVVSKVLMSIGDLFMWVVQKVAGANISIDAFVFNEYEDTMVDFFEPTGGTYYDTITRVVNGWFDAFQYFAIIIMMIILVAIGVKSILYAGTGKQKQISMMIAGWIFAVGIMFFGPYLMKYAIRINNVFVATIRDESKHNLYSIYNFEFSGDYQFGEDSETDLVSKLEAAIADVTGDREELQEEKTNLRTKMDSSIRSLFERESGFIKTTTSYLETTQSGKYTKKPIRITRKYQLTNIINQVASGTSSMYTGDNAMEDFLNDLHYVDDAGNETAKLSTINKNLLRDYCDAYTEYLGKTQDLQKLKKALQIAKNNKDLMGEMKVRAGATYRLVYVLIWLALIYQLVLMMIIYYKRLLTVAVLITIFPLVVMMYAFEKFMGIEKPKTMKTWITEFTVNVFIQSVHALMYLMLVETGLTLYEKDSDNWLVFIFAVSAMFPMESIVKGLIGLKGSTVNSLKASADRSIALGAAAIAIAKTGGNVKDIDKRFDAREENIEKKNARKDTKKELDRQKERNSVQRARLNGGENEDSRERLKQLEERYKQEDAKTAEKRAKAAKTRKRVREMSKKVQVARNVGAKMGAITTGLAGGGDPEDFMAGAAISGMIAGSTRVSPKDKKKSSETAKAGGNRYSGVSVTNNGSAATANANSNGTASHNISGGMPNSSFAGDTNTAENTTSANTEESKPQVKDSVADAIRNQISMKRDIDVSSSSDYNIIDND